jgi:NitT/TauT family transport system substrate-binding protein
MNHPLSRRQGLRALGLAAVAAVGLAACGGGGATSAKTSGGLTKITVIRSTGATFEPLIIAQNRGIFAKHGLAVTFKTAAAGGSATSVPRVINGEAQFSMADISSITQAVARGLPVKAVSTIQLATSTDPVGDGLLVMPNSPIKSYGDLAGKKVGVSALGGFPQLFVTIGAKKAGVAADKIQFVQLPTQSLVDSAKKGSVDAIISFASFYDAAKEAGLRPIGNGSNDLPGAPQALFFAGTQWLAKNTATTRKFQDAMAEAYTYANAHVDEIRAVDKQYTQLPAAYIDKRTIQKFGGSANQEVCAEVAGALVDLKIVSKAPSFDDLYWH